MKEQRKIRITGLRNRKREILAQMRAMRGNPNVRNLEHKLDRLNDQVLTITERIRKLRERG
jgi:predicted  nucleic acid-binding Zn-ribbon protein